MPNIEPDNPQTRIDLDYQLYQVENNIFYNGDESERDNRFRCYEYCLYLFYRTDNDIQSELRQLSRELSNNWTSTGQWNLGNYIVVQYDGPGPLHYVNDNYNLIKITMDRLNNRGIIDEYRLRKRYPELP